ncbi:MAG: putative addiction module antidote protein [Spirochaetaceae bacterium]|jgi:probable addiction module antidote protein|nr:putative addiction module antidote protein [Spirochaetaceae bacterium]
MAKTKTKIEWAEWDGAELLDTAEDVLLYLDEAIQGAIEDNDPGLLFDVVGDIARSKGMVELAKKLNLDRASLYKALSSQGNPSFFTLLRVLNQLGIRLHPAFSNTTNETLQIPQKRQTTHKNKKTMAII